MSIITTLVAVTQSARNLYIRVRNKAIKAIEVRLADIEDELANVEMRRSKNMVAVHAAYYEAREKHKADYEKALADLESRFTQQLNAIDSKFAEDKKTVALIACGASKELQRERTMLSTELDRLTK